MAQKEEEEKLKERKRKHDVAELMASRSERDKNKIRKMLKVTKSANRSVLDDAVDKNDTAITLNGPEQPDEDDYGYTSQAASSIYQNLMDKYKTMPEEKKFCDPKRRSNNGDLMSTKDRVRAAIEQEKEDAKLGRKRMTSSTTSHSSSEHRGSTSHSSSHHSRKNLYDPKAEREEEERRRRDEDEQRRKMKPKRPPPPVIDFQNLLKLAEAKQFEPIEVEVPQKPKEPERLLTSKEKKELEMKKAQMEQRIRRLNGLNEKPSSESQKDNNNRKIGFTANGRIPKLGSSTSTKPSSSSNHSTLDVRKGNAPTQSSSYKGEAPRMKPASKPNVPSHSATTSKSVSSHQIQKSSKISPVRSASSYQSIDKRPVDNGKSSRDRDNMKLMNGSSAHKSSKPNASKERSIDPKLMKSREFPPKDIKPREFPPKDIKPREFPPKDLKTREFPPRDVKTREFPPKDIKAREFPPRDLKSREFPPRDMQRSSMQPKKRPMAAPKRRIIDDDESEYDSEMDDFIDDDPQENDYSKYIKEIFGYDKSKYRYDDDDVDNMESNFAQQQREEFISKKIGLMEDLEDMRMEEEEKKRKKAKRRRL